MSERETCQKKFRSLITMVALISPLNSKAYKIVDGIMDTHTCDSFNNLERLREMYDEETTVPDMKRIATYGPRVDEEDAAFRKVCRMKKYTISTLYKGLDTEGKLWYYTMHKWERFVKFFCDL